MSSKNSTRTRYAMKNMIGTLVSHVLSIILGFISQRIFVRTLGTEYLGINGLFTNIISMLSVIELGFGSAIIYNLYKPIANEQKEEIKTLMAFYKKIYSLIALIIAIIGAILIPFLHKIVGVTSIDWNEILIIYILFIVDVVVSYFLTYKRSILYANQKNYIINIVHIGYIVTINLFEILIILLTKNYLLFLIFKVIIRFVENLVINIIVDKNYKFLKEKNIKKITKETYNEIIKRVKGLIFHKIGVFLVAGTDNIIISSFLGVSTVGLYSNYSMVITALQTIVNQIFSSFKASIGNLLVTEKGKSYEVFKRMQFFNFWLAMNSTLGIYVVMNDLITLWIGEEYLLSEFVLIVLSISNYTYISKLCCSNFLEAAGVFYEDRYVPIIESIVNIGMSVILLHFFGLAGVFLGTICSHLIGHIYTYPKFLYKNIFNKSSIQYFKDSMQYFMFTITVGMFMSLLMKYVKMEGIILLIIEIFIAIIIPNLLCVLLFYRKAEYKYYIELINNNIQKIIKRIKKLTNNS